MENRYQLTHATPIYVQDGPRQKATHDVYPAGTIFDEIAKGWYVLEDGNIFTWDAPLEWCEPVPLNEHQKRTIERVKVMEEFIRTGEVEYALAGRGNPFSRTASPDWNWAVCEYRPANDSATPLDIPWDKVHDKWVCATMDKSRRVFVSNTPEVAIRAGESIWCAVNEGGEWRQLDRQVLKVNTEGVDWRRSKTLRPQ